MTAREYAQHYVGALGWAIVPIPAGSKGPTGRGWNQPGGYIQDEPRATRFWEERPEMGMGLVHGPSQTAILDIDRPEWWELLGIEGVSSPVEIQGRRAKPKPLFRIPQGAMGATGLTRRALTWPDPDNPAARVCVFELRAGGVQDVLPPSLHPAGMHYTWAGALPEEPEDIPEVPDVLLNLWGNWEKEKERLEAMCPWRPMKQQKQPTIANKAPRVNNMEDYRPSTGNSLIQAYNAAYSPVVLLERNGYKPRGQGRWEAPNSSTHLAGVVALPNTHRVYSHHGSDSLADGHSHDAFDLLRILECGGSMEEAVAVAKEVLGWKTTGENKNPPPVPTSILAAPSVTPKRRWDIPIEHRLGRNEPRRYKPPEEANEDIES